MFWKISAKFILIPMNIWPSTKCIHKHKKERTHQMQTMRLVPVATHEWMDRQTDRRTWLFRFSCCYWFRTYVEWYISPKARCKIFAEINIPSCGMCHKFSISAMHYIGLIRIVSNKSAYQVQLRIMTCNQIGLVYNIDCF